MDNFLNNILKHRIFALSYIGLLSGIFFILAFFSNKYTPLSFLSPFASMLNPLNEDELKNGYEIFGFAPYWTLDKLDNIDFNVLTTLAYFGVEVDSDGLLIKDGGYNNFHSEKATNLFKKAHKNGTRVVLTLTQMDNAKIESFLDSPTAQKKAIDESVNLVLGRGIDGVNIDFEYSGNPGDEYRNKFSAFVKNLSQKMHSAHDEAHVTVSVYASAGKTRQLYDLSLLSNSTDGIFMMAYDFATAGSENAIPTSPLYGHKDGQYWYDVSTAVEDFLKVMPKEKLILGLPWYGYNYPVGSPQIKAPKDYGYYAYAYNRRGYRYSYFVPRQGAHAQTYTLASENITPEQEGWDEKGQVGWKAYKDESGQWRMIFLDDVRSLGVKYDFAKEKGLGGVGMWALGFDHGKKELWTLLNDKFGTKLVDVRIKNRQIYGI